MKLLLFGRDGKVGSVLGPALRAAGHDVTGVEVGETPALEGQDAAIDFTAPAAVLGNAREALGAGIPCLVGTTGLTQDGHDALARSGAVAGLCPLTEASLGDGIFNGVDYLVAGGRFGIGTDSNIQIDAAGELRQLEYGQRLAHLGRNMMATLEGESHRTALVHHRSRWEYSSSRPARRRDRVRTPGRHRCARRRACRSRGIAQ